MRFDEEGFLEAESGDPEVVRKTAPTDYGAIKTDSGWPDLIATHRTANYIGYGVSDHVGDGSQGMADRIELGSKRYFAHFIVSRDGTIFQSTPVKRATMHTEGSYQGRETNKRSLGIEFTSTAAIRKDGSIVGENKPGRVDMTRDDIVKRDGNPLYDQSLTTAQLQSGAGIIRALTEKTGFEPDDTNVRSHKQLGSGGHDDPGVPWSDLYPFVYGRPYRPPFPLTAVLLGAALLATAGAALYLHQTNQRPRWVPGWLPT